MDKHANFILTSLNEGVSKTQIAKRLQSAGYFQGATIDSIRFRINRWLKKTQPTDDSISHFENNSLTDTNQYFDTPKMSALKPDGSLMNIHEYCSHYGIPADQVRTYKLVSHTGVPYYNIASNNLNEAGRSPIDVFKSYVDEAIEVVTNRHEWSVDKVDPTGDNLFVPCVFDLHLGKLAWGEETGEDYDSKIAERRFISAIEDMIAKASGTKFDKVLFIVGNDIFNSDKSFPYGQTTAGTPQTDDVRYQKMFRTGIRLMTWAIQRLGEIASVDVVTVFSNHDYERVFYLGEVLSAIYTNHPNVNVDNSPKPRKYYQYGANLIGLAHGHGEKPDVLPLLMAQEAKEMWSETSYREWLLGHIHHKKQLLTQSSKDYNGVKITYLTSPSSPDLWHSQNGYVGSIKGAEAFVYNKKEGLILTCTHNIL